MKNSEFKLDYTQKDLPAYLLRLGLGLLALGLVIVVAGYFVDHTRSAFNNLVYLMFLTSVGVGALFLIAAEYIIGSVWSVPFRRINEFLAAVVLILPLVALPVYFHAHDLYHWTHLEEVMSDKILKGKSAYLNMEFFTIRIIFFFAIWMLFYFVMTRISKKQDKTGDQKYTKSNIKMSAIFLPFFAITVTFASIDWMMSLEPHWFSTIYGVYYFAGTMLTALGGATYAIVKLTEKGYLTGIKPDHYYSLGALMFAFVNFWAYIAFSQYMLYWYANMPEETFWFIDRWQNGWMTYTLVMMVIRFLVPYIALLSQPAKMRPGTLKFAGLWMLFAQVVDLYWLVMPTYDKGGFNFGWIEIGYPLAAVGAIITVFYLRSRGENFMPIGDPKLKRGINFRL